MGKVVFPLVPSASAATEDEDAKKEAGESLLKASPHVYTIIPFPPFCPEPMWCGFPLCSPL